jgi:CRP-like cAMP-binding protein
LPTTTHDESEVNGSRIVPMRLHKNAKIELIKSVPLFSKCTKKELAAIAAEADELILPEGRALTRQGRRGREFVVIAEGSADVSRNGRRINRLGSGDFLGEIALISDAPRTATVNTTSETRVLVLTDRAFRRVTREMPSIGASVLEALSERLRADTTP